MNTILWFANCDRNHGKWVSIQGWPRRVTYTCLQCELPVLFINHEES